MNEAITMKQIDALDEAFLASEKNLVAMNAAVENGILKAARRSGLAADYQNAFSVEVDAGKVCDQKKSGRCWMFAALNVMRLDVMKKLKLENMELSQSYPLFYDKLEKANFFLENIMETLDEETDSRVMAHLLMDPLGDGGQWDMFRSLVEKYGVVPKEVYPESFTSSETHMLNELMTKKLREYALRLRSMHRDGADKKALRAEKDGMLAVIHRMLCISLGTPPKRFTWETRDKDKKFVRVENITPQNFFKKYVGWKLADMVSVINAPTADKPYGKSYTVQYLGNVRDGAYPVKYLNLPVEDLKKLTVKHLKAGKIVWFGSDVSQFSDSKGGFLTLDAYDFGRLFDTDFPMDKAERLEYGESLMTHAMAITGVDLDKKGKPLRWKVENSWGEENGFKGYYVMGDDWFTEYVYQILIDKKDLTQTQQKQYDRKPVVLKPWDPMGSLA